MKRHFSSYRFTAAKKPLAFVPYDDILNELPPRIKDKRKQFFDIYFNIDLSEYGIY